MKERREVDQIRRCSKSVKDENTGDCGCPGKVSFSLVAATKEDV